MPKITYVEFDGSRHSYDVQTGTSVMIGAITNDVRGITAECGGACACATCQVDIDPEWLGKVPAPSPLELSMLDAVEESNPNRRLSCQIICSEDLDGLVVNVPESQY